MTDFRGPLPLGDRDFQEIRARVMEKIENPSPARFVIPAFALAAMALIALVLIPGRPVMPNKPPLTRPIALPQPAAVPPPAFGVRRLDAALHVKAVPRHRTPKAVASKRDIYMEIHTADPDVRIIWISSR